MRTVLCESACLVRANDGETAQCLHCRQLTDDGVVVRHDCEQGADKTFMSSLRSTPYRQDTTVCENWL